jgi:DNA-binding FadR family transcriptional regulator
MGRAGAEEAQQWFEEQIRMGRFRPGDLFPSERALSLRLCVSRGAIREAKARLAGRGLLNIQQGMRTRFSSSDAATTFQDWLHQQPREGSLAFRRRVKEVLAFHRLLFPELLSAPKDRASS